MEKKYTKLQGDFEAAMAEVEILEMKLESAEDDDNDILEIREGKRGKPVRLEDTHLMRQLPIASEASMNPLVIRLKTEQNSRIAAMASPIDNPWLTKL
jgi:hypothetical protein